MEIFLVNSNCIYEVESLARMLYPGTTRGVGIPSGDYVLCEKKDDIAKITICINNIIKNAELKIDENTTEEYAFCRLLYENSGRTLPWGMLTGIRPIKLYHRYPAKQIEEHYLVTKEMSDLAVQVAKAEDVINAKADPMGFSLYISIPFCPARCTYCSFVSHDIVHMKKYIPSYLETLKMDIKKTLETASNVGLKLQTIYIGGGTPTTLSAEQLDDLLSILPNPPLEFTVEAGRPDTITREKLEVLHKHNVNRISINPQSMNDRILKAVGRNHTSSDIIECFKIAKEVGIPVINMDLIAGLEDETYEEFIASLYRVIDLNPENITVHTLTLKRASTLTEQGRADFFYKRQQEITKMVENARTILTKAQYNPYYLYRQKNSVGALHNIGYCKPGTEGHYNVFIMDETHTILACGSGATTILKQPNGTMIQRIFEPKFPQDYIVKSVNNVNKYQTINTFNSAK